jgi:hypothetical protein
MLEEAAGKGRRMKPRKSLIPSNNNIMEPRDLAEVSGVQTAVEEQSSGMKRTNGGN